MPDYAKKSLALQPTNWLCPLSNNCIQAFVISGPSHADMF